MAAEVPPYFDSLIDAFQRGIGERFVHLGHWDEPPALDVEPRDGEFEEAQDRLNEALLVLADLDSTIDIYHPSFFRPNGGAYDWIDVNGNGYHPN